MLGISYGELFLIVGATAALVGPKDLPRIARTAGRLAGRAIGYVQLARGHFDTVMRNSQFDPVQKDIQSKLEQLDAILYEMRSGVSMIPGPLTRRRVDNLDHSSASNGNSTPERIDEESRSTATTSKDYSSTTFGSSKMHSQATAYARLAESAAMRSGSMEGTPDVDKIDGETDLFTVLPVSAEAAKLLPKHQDSGDAKGSDIMLQAIVEADVANNAKDFFAASENQIKHD